MSTYLDFNAGAPLSDVARQAMTAAMDVVGNPSSVHRPGRTAHALLERSRAAVAAAVGADAENVVFTASGTEACALSLRIGGRGRILAAATEHVAILENAPAGAAVLPVDGDGVVQLAALRDALGEDGSDAIVAVMLANNETGVFQPIEAVAEIAHAAGALLAVDAAQAFGKTAVDLAALGADCIALSSSKVGGPLGVGALAYRAGCAPRPILRGGGQERGLRGGTENLVGIAGFGAAAAEAAASVESQAEIRRLRDLLEEKIVAKAPDAIVVGRDAPRLANTAAIVMPGTPSATQVMALDLAGYAISAGAACSSGKVARSHVLDAMGLAPDLAGAAIRVSLGPGVVRQDIEGFVEAWLALYMRRRDARPEAAAE